MNADQKREWATLLESLGDAKPNAATEFYRLDENGDSVAKQYLRQLAADLRADAMPSGICDCGHPVSYHHTDHDGSFHCGWCPPHSSLRCACKAVTTTGTARNEVYDKAAPLPAGSSER